MKTLPALIALVALVALAAGCTAVPANRITADLKGGVLSITSPKNAAVHRLLIEWHSNSVVRVSVGSWCSTNDAAVIDKASAGRAAELQAVGQLVQQVTATAVATAARAAK